MLCSTVMISFLQLYILRSLCSLSYTVKCMVRLCIDLILAHFQSSFPRLRTLSSLSMLAGNTSKIVSFANKKIRRAAINSIYALNPAQIYIFQLHS